MNDWVSVTEDMPQLDPHYKNLSVEVEVMLKDGTNTEAFYADNYARWYCVKTCRRIPDSNDVVKWRSRND